MRKKVVVAVTVIVDVLAGPEPSGNLPQRRYGGLRLLETEAPMAMCLKRRPLLR
jgi:hypothetical protein